MFEYEDEISARLSEWKTCPKCGRRVQAFDMEGQVCKYCTGKLRDPCEGCGGEDCACCGKKEL